MTTDRKPPRRCWPTGHSGWVFDGIAQFEGAATTFLAEGAARRERLVFVADDPDPNRWPERYVQRGALIVASTAEIYGPARSVVATAQLEAFAGLLAEALRAGYRGLRVAADNTSLIAGPERLEPWIRWEESADAFMATNPVTGLCAFDRTRADQASLCRVVRAHRVTVT